MIIVTGANGFIGSRIIKELNRRDFSDIVAVDFFSPNDLRSLITKDEFKTFLYPNELFKFLETNKPDYIIHMGAVSSTLETDMWKLKRENIDYPAKLFKYAQKHGAVFIYASSASVYGDGRDGFSDNLHQGKLFPNSLYGWSKKEFDGWILRQCKPKDQWYGLRYFNVFGPGEENKGPMSSIIPRAYIEIRKTGKVQLFREEPAFFVGPMARDFVYVKDVVKMTCDLIHNRIESGIYNIGSGQTKTWKEIVTPIFEDAVIPVKIEYKKLPYDSLITYQSFTLAPMEKWIKAGGTKPAWDPIDAVRDYLEYLKEKK